MNCGYNIVQNVKQKLEEILDDDITYSTVENAFKDISKMKESAYHKYLQFKMLHSRTITNEKLYIMKISDSNICKMCMTEIETINHAFIDCTKVKQLWSQVEKQIRDKVFRLCKISDTDKNFGQRAKEEISDKTITATKALIYDNRKTGII